MGFKYWLKTDSLLPELKSSKNKSSSLEVIKIEGNQWECDCHNQWLLDLMNENRYLKYAQNAECTRPTKFKGFNFIEAKNAELPCEDQETFDPKKRDFGRAHPPAIYNRGEKHMITLTIAVGCILAVLGKVFFHKVTYPKNERKIPEKFVPEVQVMSNIRRVSLMFGKSDQETLS